MKGTINRQVTTQKPNVYGNVMANFFGVKDHFLLDVVQQKINGKILAFGL
jgi:hypothetical protein